MSAPTEPTVFLNWTDGSPSKVVQPPSTQQLSGWTVGEPIPMQYLNWLFWLTDQWIQWLDYITEPTNRQATITGNTTTAFPISTYLCDASGGGFTATLGLAATLGTGYRVTLKNISIGSSNNVSVARSGSDLIEGGTSDTLSQGDVRTYESDGVSNWWQVA